MALAVPAKSKINTEITQPAPNRASRRGGKGSRGAIRVAGDARESARDPGRAVIEVGCGIVVYPPEEAGVPWRPALPQTRPPRARPPRPGAGLPAGPGEAHPPPGPPRARPASARPP